MPVDTAGKRGRRNRACRRGAAAAGHVSPRASTTFRNPASKAGTSTSSSGTRTPRRIKRLTPCRLLARSVRRRLRRIGHAPAETPMIDGTASDLSVSMCARDRAAQRSSPGATTARTRWCSAAAARDEIHKRGDEVEVVAGTKRATMRITGVMLNRRQSVLHGPIRPRSRNDAGGLRRLEPTRSWCCSRCVTCPGWIGARCWRGCSIDFGHWCCSTRRAGRRKPRSRRVCRAPRRAKRLRRHGDVWRALLTSVRRRREEFATLRAIGFLRRQRSAIVIWQTWALTLAGVVLGIPVGVVIGRSLWRIVAARIGSVQPPAVGIGTLALIVALAAFAATGVALVPHGSPAGHRSRTANSAVIVC